MNRPSSDSRVRPAYLFAAAAVILAAAALVAVWRRAWSGREDVAAAAGAPVPAASPTVPGAGQESAAEPLPTHGPKRAADASVGWARGTADAGAAPSRQAPAPLGEARAEPSAALAAGAGSDRSPGGSRPDAVYRTRRYAKFSVSPDQARLYVDGRYVGVADDWDGYGGGRTLEFPREGAHRVRLELPGYRTMNLEIIATPAAGDETVDIGDELTRESKISFPKTPKMDERTVGPVEFQVDPPDTQVSEGSRILGPASAFGPESPLQLSGPMVHDLLLSAPGRKSRIIRILVARNADRDKAKVKLELKKE